MLGKSLTRLSSYSSFFFPYVALNHREVNVVNFRDMFRVVRSIDKIKHHPQNSSLDVNRLAAILPEFEYACSILSRFEDDCTSASLASLPILLFVPRCWSFVRRVTDLFLLDSVATEIGLSADKVWIIQTGRFTVQSIWVRKQRATQPVV